MLAVPAVPLRGHCRDMYRRAVWVAVLLTVVCLLGEL